MLYFSGLFWASTVFAFIGEWVIEVLINEAANSSPGALSGLRAAGYSFFFNRAAKIPSVL